VKAGNIYPLHLLAKTTNRLMAPARRKIICTLHLERNKKMQIVTVTGVFSTKLGKSCFNLIRGNGRFKSDKQKEFFLGYRTNNQGHIESLYEEIKVAIVSADKMIVYFTTVYSGKDINKKGNTNHYAFLIDETGVRMSFRKSFFWKKVKRSPAPFDKEKWKDTAFRRREHNAGLREAEMEFFQARSETIFER
jgi:hypothetical protein